MSRTTKIEVSTGSLLKAVGVVLAFWFLFLIKGILGILFVAVVLASALDPIVIWLTRRKIPRLLAVMIIYILVLSLISLVIILLWPAVTTQIQNLASNFPAYWQKISEGISALENYSAEYGVATTVQNSLNQAEQFFTASGQGVFTVLANVFGGLMSFLVIMVITFYLLLEESSTKKILRFVAPARYQPYITRLLFKMRDKIGRWLRGQIILSLIIALIVYLGLNILGIFVPVFAKYALVLALLAFLFEFIPYLGPILAALPAVFIGLTQSLVIAGGVLGGYMVMQWLENNLIVPQVMKRATGLNPIIVIIALMIGAEIGGIVGMALAIPVTTALVVMIEEVSRELDQKELTEEEVD
ncbi:MAG: AI-2E family transporter [Patescibacteria group bacterium]|jgi:predicted PurR-regulated permease PerM